MTKEKSVQKIWQGVLREGTQLAYEKKQRIVEATIQIIATEGVDAVTFESIGKKLKTTKANVKYHFQDKDELIFMAARLAVVNAQAMTLAYVERETKPEDKLAAIIFAGYEWYQQFPDHFRVWSLFFYYANVHERYTDFFVTTRAAGQGRMALLLRALPRAAGAAANEAPYDQLASFIQNLIYGQIIGLTGRPREIRQSRAETAEIVSTVLRSKGIQWSAKL